MAILNILTRNTMEYSNYVHKIWLELDRLLLKLFLCLRSMKFSSGGLIYLTEISTASLLLPTLNQIDFF